MDGLVSIPILGGCDNLFELDSLGVKEVVAAFYQLRLCTFSVYRILAIPTVVTHCSHVCRTWRLHSQAMKCCISLVTVMWGIMMAGRGQHQLHWSSNVLISTNNITAVHTLRRSQSFDFYVYNGIKRMVRVPESWFMNMSSKYFKHRLFFQIERGRVGRWWSGDRVIPPPHQKHENLDN